MPNLLCQCGGPGWCSRHRMHKTVRQWQACSGNATDMADCGRKYWIAWELGKAGAEKPEHPTIEPNSFCDGLPIASKSFPEGCCGGAAGGGIKNMLAKAARRAVQLAESAVNFVGDGMKLATIEQETHRADICSACSLNTGGWCDDSKGGCGCNLGLKIKARVAYCPQSKWFAYGDNYRPLVNPTRNLIFHIYPKNKAEWNWHWHIEQIRRVAHLFNGKICIGIVYGSGLAPVEEVQKQFDGIPVTDWIVRKNIPFLSETTTAVDLLKLVQTDDPNTITLRGHTKGVTKLNADTIEQYWARLMWAACMDLPSVEDALASHLTAGALKCHEPLVSHQRYKWFYAGSFYWFRNKEAFERDWSTFEQTRWYIEAWPGVLFTNEEAANLCHDFTDGSVLREPYWEKVVKPSWEAWKAARPDRMVELEV